MKNYFEEFYNRYEELKSDLEKIVSDLKAATPDLSLNVVMKHLKETYAGQYDGKSASDVAKRLLG